MSSLASLKGFCFSPRYQDHLGKSFFEGSCVDLTCKYQPPHYDYVRKVQASVVPVISVFRFAVSLLPLQTQPLELLLN